MNSGSILVRESSCFITALRTGSMAQDSLPSTRYSRMSFPFFPPWLLSVADWPWNTARAWQITGREELFLNNSFCARKLMNTYFMFMVQLHLWQHNKDCLHSWVFMNGNISHTEQLVIFAKWWMARTYHLWLIYYLIYLYHLRYFHFLHLYFHYCIIALVMVLSVVFSFYPK